MGDEHDSWAVKLGVPQASFSPSLTLSPDALQKIVEDSVEKDRKAAADMLAKVTKQLTDADSYLKAMEQDKLLKMNYASVMTDVRQRYPDLANLSEWVQDTAKRLPEMSGKLPSRKALIDTVDKALDSRQIKLLWNMGKGKDFAGIATDRLLASYMSELPSGVGISIENGIVQLTREGAAMTVNTRDGSVTISNDTWAYFDPKLKAQWRSVSDEGTALAKLNADLDKLKLQYESKGKDGSDVSAEGALKVKQMQAEFDLRWKKLRESVDLTAKASTDQISAAVEYLKKDSNKADLLKAGADLELNLKEMNASFKAYVSNPSVKGVLTVTASGDKVTANLEVATKVLKASVSASSSGDVSGKVQIDIELEKGLSFLGPGQKLSFTGNVSNKKYSFGVAFSVGEPVEIGSVQTLFQQADKQIQALYKLAADEGVRNIKDAKELAAKVQDVVKPIKEAADKAKTIKGKAAIQLSFGFQVEGEWPTGGQHSPPTASFKVMITF